MTGPLPLRFVVREPGRWTITTVPGSGSEATDLSGVLALLTSARAGDVVPPPSGPTSAATDRDDGPARVGEGVEPAWSLVARVGTHGVEVRPPSGETAVLDADDLRILDLIDSPRAVHAVVQEATARSIALPTERLTRLAEIGAIRFGSAPRAQTEATSDGPADGGDGPAAAGVPSAPPPAADGAGRRRWRIRRRRQAGTVTDRRIPVYAIWHPETGPLLSLGMLTAAARHHRDGELNSCYEIRAPETAASFLADQAERSGPAVLLCSDYVWTVEANLETARLGLAANPDLIVIHGGPSSPKYEADADHFLDEHGPVAHVLTRGEGEHLIGELLEALAPTLPALDAERLSEIEGLTFRDPGTGRVVRTNDRPRITDLDALPSPYLSGEFDHIPIDRWLFCLSIETNRGCPYSCSYCDWGSSTLSRIRKFSLERVRAEIEWAAARGAVSINLPDANFGILSRDVETAAAIARSHEETGFPLVLSFYPAKNTTKHLVRIMDLLTESGVGTTASISLQTTDPDTLEAIDRSNISTDHYVALAASYRRRGFPIQGDLLIGLPGQTYESYRADLQFNLDHEIQARTWQLKVLPNAPMNAPEYRALHQIASDDQHLVRSTATFTERDRDRMLRLRDLDIVAERLGVLRHVLRWLQWDHGVQASDVLDRILDVTELTPHRLPHLSWLTSHFERHATAPGGWPSVYEDVRRLLTEDFAIAPSPTLDTVIELNEFLMPWPGRTFPASIELRHDYVEYYRDATHSLYTHGHATGPSRPLHSYPPATFTVMADPLNLCRDGIAFPRPGEDESMESDFSIGANSAHELLSPLLRLQPHLLAIGVSVHDLPPGAPSAQGLGLPDEPPTRRSVVGVALTRAPSTQAPA